ncbi:hypothetical protein GCM10027578_27490 [Spirosoma luteolum]
MPLADPFGEPIGPFQPAATGSMAPAFARSLYDLTGQPIILVSTARGGSSCHQKSEKEGFGTWADEGNLPLFTESAAMTRRAMQKTKLPLSGIIWLQGERDANAISDKQLTGEEYADALTSVITRFRKSLGATVPVYIIQTGFQEGRPRRGSRIVRRIQARIARQTPFTYIAYRKTTSFFRRGWMKDYVHYSQPALNQIGDRVARFVRRHMG